MHCQKHNLKIGSKGCELCKTERALALDFQSRDIGEHPTAPPRRINDDTEKKLERVEAFVKRLLDPEGLGHAVTEEIRDEAREALGLPRVYKDGKKRCITCGSTNHGGNDPCPFMCRPS